MTEKESARNDCPLCGSDRSTIWKRAGAKAVSHVYRKSLGVDIDRDIEGITEFLLLRCGSCDLGYFSPLRAGGHEFYEQLQRLEFYYPGNKSEFGFASRYIGTSADVLEIGCGAGWFADRINAKSYTGLEFTDKAVQMARSRGLKVDRRSIEEYAEENPQSADIVCAFQVLEHVTSPKVFLRAALQTLRPDGRLILSVPSADSFMSEAVNNVLNMPPHHVTWWTDKALQELGRQLSLEIEAIEHELLGDEHVEHYLYTLYIRGMEKNGDSTDLINLSRRFRLLHRVASFIVPSLARGLKNQNLRPKGHSVTIVYRKR